VTYIRFENLRAWDKSKLPYEKKTGPSPGGAANQLGVSRQCVYNWVKRGILDRVDVLPDTYKPLPRWLKVIDRLSEDQLEASRSYSYITLESIHRVQKVLLDLAHERDIDLNQINALTGANITRELEARLVQPDMIPTVDLDEP
jgi:hypothetical protein